MAEVNYASATQSRHNDALVKWVKKYSKFKDFSWHDVVHTDEKSFSLHGPY